MFNFIKIHACGNDFIVLFKNEKKIFLKKILNKKTNLSCDQLLIINNINLKYNTIKIKIYNNNLSKAQNCGNGIRCLAWYFLTKKNKNKIINFNLNNNFIYSFKNKNTYTFYKIPKNKIIYIRIKKYFFKIFFVNLINLHLVFIIKNINSYLLKFISKIIIFYFGDKYNIEFLQLLKKNNIYIRIFERNVGETYSCGSGIISSISCIKKFFLNNFKINSIGGICFIKFIKKFVIIYGKVNFCFFGYI
ncbi:diaminopimelate epimerase [Candidatus Carsonella ruddii]|uniref:hypothetical protein n=1 Tax=Carsonella ruddii TaxID=114186 RepID=UPI00247A6F8D|nr:hypothetical protein [Candidatus Carsonella ruddii]WGS66664.1 hypothetical protein MEJ66_01120 [Candidatus Carsonella ruddii]